MFEFGDKTSGKDWYYEGPDETPKISDAVNTGSIDTSAIDQYRQGVEITQQSHWSSGILKIHAGETNHLLRRNTFGQDVPGINDEQALNTSWYKDIDYFDPVKYIEAQTSGTFAYISNLTFPIVTHDTDEIENFIFNGVIEPFAIRSVASFFSTHVGGYAANSVKGTVMAGNSDVRLASEPIVHVHRYETAYSTTPFLDMIDMIGNTPTEAYFDNSVVAISPYDDAGGSREIEENSVHKRNAHDMNSAISNLKFDTENYVPTGEVSPTSGFIFDNTPAGTDSLAFGGMTY